MQQESSRRDVALELDQIKVEIDQNDDKLNSQPSIILGKLSENITEDQISEKLKNQGFDFLCVKKLSKEEIEKQGLIFNRNVVSSDAKGDRAPSKARNNSKKQDGSQDKPKKQHSNSISQNMMMVIFKERQSLIKLSHFILFEQVHRSFGNNKKSQKTEAITDAKPSKNPEEQTENTEKKQDRLYLVHQRIKGHYNPETSIHIGNLHPDCREEDLIEEINLLLRDDRIKRQDSEKKINNFILSAFVIIDKETQKSKRFAFVDFNCKQAAQICIDRWDNGSMKKFHGRLFVSFYDKEYTSMSKEERIREQSRNREERPQFSNLYVDKLPYTFVEQDVYELFGQYGFVKSVLFKKPYSNVLLKNVNFNPCSALVNFQTDAQAQAAMRALSGRQLIQGGNHLRIEVYQRSNRFLGGLIGLNRHELISNTHFRVLFIRGLYKEVSKDQLQKICEKYGEVETVCLKTKVEDLQVKSRGLAIVQYSKKSEASEALKKLPFERDLGELLDIDFYQSKESRVQTVDVKEELPISQVFNSIFAQLTQLSSVRSSLGNKTSATSKKPGNPDGNKRYQRNRQNKKHQGKNEKRATSSSQNKDKIGQANSLLQQQPNKSRSKSVASTNQKPQKTKQNEKQRGSQDQKAPSGQQKDKSLDNSQQKKKVEKPAQKMEYRPKSSLTAEPSKETQEPQVKKQQQRKRKGGEILIAIPESEFTLINEEDEKKQYLGNYFYQIILNHVKSLGKEEQKSEEIAGRVTGMILDGQNSQFLKGLCANKKNFFVLVSEALNLLGNQ